ncbi:hypothetical protein N657DRAFT_167749 [Parathielavia appendiculata]|uniref:Uncharacterized protein n=1 Tax=Parathielavia appendiculata TaxID=2587402 RepID=A0AAN6YZL1_9PEZI|nr:hypothetical protein N657DRAFT_167749 [Parathielavia appendiculata]
MPSVTAPFDSLLLPLLFSVVVISAPQCYLPNGEATNSISLAGMQGLSRPACAATSRTIVTTTQSALLTLLKTANLISIAGPAFSKEDWSNPACPQFCVVPSHNDDGVEPMDRCGFEQDGFWDCSSGCFELPGMQLNPTLGRCMVGCADFPIQVTLMCMASRTQGRNCGLLRQIQRRGVRQQQKVLPRVVVPQAQQTSPTYTQSSLSSPAPGTATDSSSRGTSTPPLFASHPDAASTASAATTPQPGTAGASSPITAQSSAPQGDGKPNWAVPIGVGVAVGVAILLSGRVLTFFYHRKRRRQATVRAETPPPFESSSINSQEPAWLGPSYGLKLREMDGNDNRVPEIGDTSRVELP